MLRENLLREDAPLSQDEWNAVDRVVIETASSRLVGRRFIDVQGPLGAGVQSVHQDTFVGGEAGAISMLGEDEDHAVHAEARTLVHIPMIYKDFLIHWRDIETSRAFGSPLDISGAAGAASFVAEAEDDLILNGNEKLGFEGLVNAKWRSTRTLSNWDEPGAAFRDAVDGTKTLIDAGFYGPFAMVVSPGMFAKMQRVFDNTGVLEVNQVREIITGGVLQSPVLNDDHVAIVSMGAQNLDIAIGQDLVTAYLGPEGMNHPFRVLESLVLRIKRPASICTLEKA